LLAVNGPEIVLIIAIPIVVVLLIGYLLTRLVWQRRPGAPVEPPPDGPQTPPADNPNQEHRMEEGP